MASKRIEELERRVKELEARRSVEYHYHYHYGSPYNWYPAPAPQPWWQYTTTPTGIFTSGTTSGTSPVTITSTQ